MDPFHVIRLAGNALTTCRQRVQLQIHGRRGRKLDPLYRFRRTLQTGIGYLTEKQADRLNALFAGDPHADVEATWTIYQTMTTAYREKDRTEAKTLMTDLIAHISQRVPKPLVEVRRLGRALKRRAKDALAYFDRPRTSNGPTEAINGRPERPRGSALGFRNLTNYITRCLLETGGFKPQLHPQP